VDENIDSTATVTIKLSDTNKAQGNVNLSVLKLNGSNLATPKVFEKKFLDAVVRVTSQEWKKATTIFTLDVDVADDVDYSPMGLKVLIMSGGTCT
jgi:hypothetical protein